MGSKRAAELAGALESATGELLATLEQLPDEAWQAPCPREGATVAVVVGGLADSLGAQVAALRAIATGKPPPVRRRAEVDRDVAARAGARREELLALVRADAAGAIAWVRGLDGGGLEWSGS